MEDEAPEVEEELFEVVASETDKLSFLVADLLEDTSSATTREMESPPQVVEQQVSPVITPTITPAITTARVSAKEPGSRAFEMPIESNQADDIFLPEAMIGTVTDEGTNSEGQSESFRDVRGDVTGEATVDVVKEVAESVKRQKRSISLLSPELLRENTSNSIPLSDVSATVASAAVLPRSQSVTEVLTSGGQNQAAMDTLAKLTQQLESTNGMPSNQAELQKLQTALAGVLSGSNGQVDQAKFIEFLNQASSGGVATELVNTIPAETVSDEPVYDEPVYDEPVYDELRPTNATLGSQIVKTIAATQVPETDGNDREFEASRAIAAGGITSSVLVAVADEPIEIFQPQSVITEPEARIAVRTVTETTVAEPAVSEYIKRYRKVAESGNPKAQLSLGYMYQTGEQVSVDIAEAAHWYRLAGEAGEVKAMISLGLLYESGEGIDKNLVEAAYWYRKAANSGNADAQQTIAFMYEKGDVIIKDVSEAARWYEKAAMQGRMTAQNNLGRLYQLGIGVDKNLDQAIFWYEKAAAQGSNAAKNNLSELLNFDAEPGLQR